MSASTTNSSGREMDCARVARDEILEAYLAGRLSEEDRDAFEGHYFECAHCFDDLRSLQDIQGGLPQGGVEAQARQGRPWLRWLPAVGLAAAAVPAVLVVWMRPDLTSPPPEAAKASPVQVSDTGGAVIPSGGLAHDGGKAGVVQLDVKEFCCPQYLSQMVQKILQNWNPRQGAGGKPTIKFTIQRDGMLTNVELEKPSGQDRLDFEARHAVVRTEQLPPLPGEFTESTLTVHLTLTPQPQPAPTAVGSSPSPEALARVEQPLLVAARQVVEAYYAAYKARDFNALQAIFPMATDIDRKRIEALRKDYEPCDYNVQGMEVDALSSTRAFVRVQLIETCPPRLRAPVQRTIAANSFQVGKTADGRWIVITGP